MNIFTKLKPAVGSLLVLLLAASFNTYAQTGIVRITTVDDGTGEKVVGATVSIEGVAKSAVTDLDGMASFRELKAGTYNITVTHVSYQSTTVTGVAVEAGKAVPLTIRLKSAAQENEAVVVTAKAMRNSERAMLTVQKKSPKIFDAITSDQFAKVGANDAASALKRVTGVTIAGGKYVYVRGLGDRYSKTTLNGADIPSLDPNKNSVQLDLFPSNLIDNMMVYKAYAPDLPGDFAGGLVNITTKDFPSSFTIQASIGTSYNKNSNLNSNTLTAQGSSTDFLGYDNNFRVVPAAVAQYTSDNFPDPYLDKTGITTVSRAFDNRQFDPGQGSHFLNHKFNFSVGNQITLFGRPLGFIFGLSYNRSFSSYFNGVQNVFEGISAGQTTLNNDILTAASEQKSTDEVLEGAMFNTSYKINRNNKIGLSIMANQAGTSDARYQTGYLLDANPDSTTHLQNRVINYMQRSFINLQVRGEHVIPSLNKLNVSWSGAYTKSSIEQPDMRLIRNQFTIDPSTGDTAYYLGNVDRPSRFFRDLDETNYNGKLDFSLPVNLFHSKDARLKFGGLYTYKDRSFRESIYQYSITYNKNFNGDISSFFQDSVLGYVNNQLRNYLIYVNIDPNNYDASQKLYAGYLMLESPLSDKLKFMAGARFERTDIELEAFDGTSGSIKNNDILPAASLTYAIDRETNLRFSASRTLARPSFREFAPLATYDFFGGYIQNGNPNLQRTVIDNLDIRWEKYPDAGEFLSFSLFYKKFSNPIENAQLPRAGGSTSQFQYKNVNNSNLFGAEVEVRKNLGEEGTPLEDFKVSANFTYVYAYVNVTDEEMLAIKAWDANAKDTRPMFNQAPYSINASLSYDNSDLGLESALNFNMTGKRLLVYQVNLPSIYLQPMPDLNFSVKKSITRQFGMRFRMDNILGNTYKEQITLGGNEYYTTKYQLGRTYNLSFDFKL